MADLLAVSIVDGKRPRSEWVVVGCFAKASPDSTALPADVAAAARAVGRRKGFDGAESQAGEAEIRGGGFVRVLGLGEERAFDDRKVARFLERALEVARSAGARRVAISIPRHAATRNAADAERIVRDAALGAYRFDRFLGDGNGSKLTEVEIVPPRGAAAIYTRASSVGRALASSIAWSRDLANTPPNEATPDWMARQAASLAKSLGARVKILGVPELKRRGMGGILAVGAGSKQPPRLVRLEWGRGGTTVALVGKGVTFDTGGISIKPADRMDEMKWDKCGACAALGILRATAALRLPLRLRVYLPLAENMPDGAAYRPSDIVRCANGKTVEILNTDAEGRVILADALSWASSEKPDYLLEYSTLTGACVVALGHTGAGLFTPHNRFADSLLAAAGAMGERLWRLPLWPEFGEEMKGAHADLKNSGGRWGGASTAAAFLSQFVGGVEKWAHLDIAGPAYVGGDQRSKRSATGYGISTTIAWLRTLGGRAR